MPAGKSRVYLQDVEVGIAAGYYEGVSDEHIFGHNAAVGTALETIWTEGGIYLYPTSALSMTVSSSDVDDDEGDTGARTVEIIGLDIDYNEISEILTLNGQTEVPTTQGYFRIQHMEVKTAGSSLWNEGIVYIGTGTVTSGKPAVVYGLIDQFENESVMGIHTIPAGVRGYVTMTLLTSAVAKAVNGGLYTREEGCLFKKQEALSLRDGQALMPHTAAERYEPKTDIEMRAVTGAGGGDISCQFELVNIKLAPR